MAEVLSIISISAFIIFGALLFLTIVLAIKFNIPKIIGDLSGHTAKKSIEHIREKNEKTGKKPFKPSIINVNRGKVTENMDTDILSDGTEVLSNVTDILERTDELTTQSAVRFTIVKEVVLIHTDEVI
ncbi:MAG: hypothetical protein K0R15_1319 [Clostridiales bacterium]|jgi:hypothetical protein|nr:hypothetical protein [Clostridiales bacterium]